MLLASYPRSLAHLVDHIEGDKVILKPEATEKDYAELQKYREWYQEQIKHPWYASIAGEGEETKDE